MIPLLGLLGAMAAGLIYATQVTVKRRQRAARAWRAVSYELGLSVTVDRTVQHCELNGTLKGATVKASVERQPLELRSVTNLLSLRQDSSSVRTLVWAAPERGPRIAAVRIRAVSLLSALQASAQSFRLGDPDFDRDVRVEGERATLLAVLGAETRDRLRRLTARGVVVEFSQVTYAEAGLEDEAGPLRRLLVEMAWAATELQLDLSQIAARIAANFRVEPHADVRLRQLETLVRDFKDRPETRAVIEIALSDRDADVLMLAAESVGARGRGIMRAAALDPELPLAARQRALAGFVDRATPSEAHALLDALFALPMDGMVMAIARAAGRAEHPDAGPWLRSVLPRTRSLEERIAVIDAAGLLAIRMMEGPLLDQVEHLDLKVRRAALRALAAVGSLACLPRLLPLTEAVVVDAESKALAKRAVRQIQAREAGGAQAGQLAIVEEAGRLALADAAPARGRLTLTEGESE